MQRLGLSSAALVLSGLSGCSEVEAHDRNRPRPLTEVGASGRVAPASPEPEAQPDGAGELHFPRVRRIEPAGVARAASEAAEVRPKPVSAEPLSAERVSAEPARPKRVDLVVVDISDQRLDLLADGAVVRSYAVSTAKNGVGSQAGSEKTPLGRHRVHKKIGAGEPLGRVFEARAATRRIATIHTDPVDLPEDVITSRILWLEGLEQGKNRGRGVDSRERFIYIHGTNEEGLVGRPASHGCVRMRNRDVIELFELVQEGTTVEIVP